MREITLSTERKTQLIDITALVKAELGDAAGSAALLYVPHTTAGVTINEFLDPELVADIERGLESLVQSGWTWNHDDKDGPNGPSHLRASLIGPQVLIPLVDGALALGTYQGIFFCEFDGPRDRKIYVSTLA